MEGKVTVNAGSIKWQGYRSGTTGFVVFYESDTESELPIRMITGTRKTDHNEMDPNYESKTYGLFDCVNSKMRNQFEKKKYGYIFFMTRYQGKIAELNDKVLITGYYKIGSTSDVQKLHLRHLEDSACINSKTCSALKADEAVFLSAEDSYKLTTAGLKSIGYDKKVTRMTKIELDEEMVKKLLKKFDGKENQIDAYIAEHAELQPILDEEEE